MTASGPVVLTAHPLQRVGAHALAHLAGKVGPRELADADFKNATEKMTAALVDTARFADSKEPGAFWLGASYLLWPNSKMNPTMRKKQSVEERRAEIRAWRTYSDDLIEAPCALCGRPACGFYGKVDVPLGASTAYRNTTTPGHDGLALCKGCLASFHALPYGCEIRAGQASALHSWDDDFLRATVGRRVDRSRQEAIPGKGPGNSKLPYAREVEALRGLREYEHRIREGVDLYVFTNNNKQQSLEVHSLRQPLAEWLRKTMRDSARREAFWLLIRTHRSEKVPGPCLLARNAFRNPQRIVSRSVSYLTARAAGDGALPSETAGLARLCASFSMEVLGVEQRDMQSIQELAGRVAELLETEGISRGTVKSYERIHRESRLLQKWLKRNGVAWLANLGKPDPLVTAEQWELLFDPDAQGWFFQDLLLVSVLQRLAENGAGPAAAAEPLSDADKQDIAIFEGEEKSE